MIFNHWSIPINENQFTNLPAMSPYGSEGRPPQPPWTIDVAFVPREPHVRIKPPWKGPWSQTLGQPMFRGFLKWWYPTTLGFPTKNDHFGVFLGYHHLRKHPFRSVGTTCGCFFFRKMYIGDKFGKFESWSKHGETFWLPGYWKGNSYSSWVVLIQSS